jgi:hypothetical protein
MRFSPQGRCRPVIRRGGLDGLADFIDPPFAS